MDTSVACTTAGRSGPAVWSRSTATRARSCPRWWGSSSPASGRGRSSSWSRRPPTDAVIELVPLLDDEDIVIDYGDAHFMDTRRREAALRETACTSSDAGCRAARKGRPRPEHHARRVRVLRGARPIFESIAAQVAARLAARTWGRMAPVTSSRWCTTASIRGHAAHREAYDLPRAGLVVAPAEMARIFRTWNKGELDSFLIQSPRGCWRARTRPGSRSWTSRRTRPSKGHRPLDGAERTRSGHPDHGSPRPRSPGPCPATRTSVKPPARRSAPRCRPGSAIRMRSSMTYAAPCTRPRWWPTRRALTTSPRAATSTTGPSTGRDGDDLARRLHHPGPVPEPDPGGLRREPRAAQPAGRALLRGSGPGRGGQLAPGGGPGRAAVIRPRRSPPRWPTTTACAGTGCPLP